VGSGGSMTEVQNASTPPEQVATRSGVGTGVPADPAALGYLDLHQRHPDGNEGVDEFIETYSVAHARQRLEQINSFLDSFRSLTRRVRGMLGQAELRSIGNTGGETQTIGLNLSILTCPRLQSRKNTSTLADSLVALQNTAMTNQSRPTSVTTFPSGSRNSARMPPQYCFSGGSVRLWSNSDILRPS